LSPTKKLTLKKQRVGKPSWLASLNMNHLGSYQAVKAWLRNSNNVFKINELPNLTTGLQNMSLSPTKNSP